MRRVAEAGDRSDCFVGSGIAEFGPSSDRSSQFAPTKRSTSHHSGFLQLLLARGRRGLALRHVLMCAMIVHDADSSWRWRVVTTRLTVSADSDASPRSFCDITVDSLMPC